MAEIQPIDLKTLKVYQLSGSSAGSSSGDFHKYRQYKLIEQQRLATLEQQAKQQHDKTEFEQKRAAENAVLEQQRLKRAEKRHKKKGKLQQLKKQKHHTDYGASQSHPSDAVNHDTVQLNNDSKEDNDVEEQPKVRQRGAITIVDTD